MSHSSVWMVLVFMSISARAGSKVFPKFRDLTSKNPHPSAVPGQYLVKFHTDAHVHFQRLRNNYKEEFHSSMEFMHHTRSNYMAMYGEFNDEQLERAKHMEGVDFVQHIYKYTTQVDTTASDGDGDDDSPLFAEEYARSWGLDRADQQFLPLNGKYRYLARGVGVTAFVLDTGVNADHPHWEEGQVEFLADCSMGLSYRCVDSSETGDPNGHGTHVAGTIASRTYGMARKTKILSIRVLNGRGHGFTPSIANALAYAIDYAKFHPGPRYVLNLSVGSNKDDTVNAKINEAWKDNIFVVAAAGNEGHDACNSSPASAEHIVAVGASTIGDSVASYSNFGACVDIFAPGDNILSLNTHFAPGGNYTVLSSGTSMSAPHVTGAAAIVLDLFPNFTTDQVAAALKASSTETVAHSIPVTTHNLLYTFDESLDPDRSGLTQYQLIMLCTAGVLALIFLVGFWYCVCRRKSSGRKYQRGRYYHRFEDDYMSSTGPGLSQRHSSLNRYNPPRLTTSTSHTQAILPSGRSPEY